MCGIAGIIHTDHERVSRALEHAQTVQQHRGPDGAGTRIEQVGRWSVGLGHRRLSIIDLTSTGNQPMASHDSQHWVTYNGEIYNYPEVRAELITLGHRFD